jgi:hypothetical protein
VQSIIQAAESAAAEIERQALEDARSVREEAGHDAERTRDEAIEKARAHVAAVSQVAAKLLQRVGSMDGEVGALMESLRSGSGRLSGDLAAIEKGMGELYDASSGRGVTGTTAGEPAATTAKPPARPPAEEPAPAPAAPQPASPAATPAPVEPAPVEPAPVEAAPAAPVSGDVDGARLIALNMALNGESREDTERYLAENFQLADRGKLVDEVYAAIEG